MTDLGPQSLKNIAEPVRAYLLRHGAPALQKPPQPAAKTLGVWERWPALAAALALVLLAGGPSPGARAWLRASWPLPLTTSSPTRRGFSIVVLPFANIGRGPEQDYFVDGVTESLTTDLSPSRRLLRDRAQHRLHLQE